MSVTIDDQGWIAEAIGIYYGADSFGPFAAGQPQWVVIHGTAWPYNGSITPAGGTAVMIARSWAAQVAAGSLGASTHIIVDKDGSYTQGITLLNTAAGNSGAPDSVREPYLPSGNLNMYTISIEHCKYNVNDLDILTPQQVDTSFALCKAICEKYGIPKQVWSVGDVRQGGIIPHSACDWKYRSGCPGPYPWADLQNYLNGGPAMFSNDGCVAVWQSKYTGFVGNGASRLTGIFDMFRSEWIAGRFRGAPDGPEYDFPTTWGLGKAQNFGSNTAWWFDATHRGWL
jgi:hypothetical protein